MDHRLPFQAQGPRHLAALCIVPDPDDPAAAELALDPAHAGALSVHAHLVSSSSTTAATGTPQAVRVLMSTLAWPPAR